ncbi:lipoyl(octanoyl) transferase LipB [Proteus hauseri]|uniref:lipoyl(octanoyl) transferase LipB n=1 Tax=Proteus hauseri TaxID=183417 RepID=UPI0032DAD53C
MKIFTVQDKTIIIRQLGVKPYLPVSDSMHQFTEKRESHTPDEIWLVQHEQVFTQGQAGKEEHLLNTGTIPVIQSDRGGQVTYHGPGQQVMYVLLDLKRNHIGVRQLVTALENTVIDTLASFNVEAYARTDAPGVYVNGDKICSLGLRIRKGCSFHGLALNIDMDLSPFMRINPCGYPDLKMTQLIDFVPDITTEQVASLLVKNFCTQLGFQPQQ